MPGILTVIRRFGYLQLDTVSVAGSRSHGLVLLSRIDGFAPRAAEELLHPGAPLFEYWGHEASWIPLDMYPLFGFRRQEYRHHPWYGDVIGEHPGLVDELLTRIEGDGPLKSSDLESAKGTWWAMKPIKKVALALWSSGDLAIRERKAFLRTFDLAERVIPEELRRQQPDTRASIAALLALALTGHGWASTGTLASTWRLKNRRSEVEAALRELQDAKLARPCALIQGDGKRVQGWIRPQDLELAENLVRLRPDRSHGVLLSPFDPVLWDRARVQQLFDFEQVLEIYKPAAQRRFGYYCLPVLAGDRLVSRVDLKWHKSSGSLEVLSCHYEAGASPPACDLEATHSAIARHAESLRQP